MKPVLTLFLLTAASTLILVANGQQPTAPFPALGVVLKIDAEQDVTVTSMSTTSGTIKRGGILNGTTSDQFKTVPLPTSDANTVSLTDVLTFTTVHGILTCNDVTLFSSSQGVFTTIAKLNGGTGIFKGATGTLFISGTSKDGVHYEDRIIGEITVPFIPQQAGS